VQSQVQSKYENAITIPRSEMQSKVQYERSWIVIFSTHHGVFEFYSGIQEKDETIWIPPGWWHAVLNIEDFTVACTSNTMTRRMLKQQRPAFDQKYPEVIERFVEVYGVGGF
jgi:hypothetical protein